MRKYEPFYNANSETWGVLGRDLDDDYWWIYLENLTEDTAKTLADALTRAAS